MTDPTPAAPIPETPAKSAVWEAAATDYLSGVSGAGVCQRYGMSMSSFRAHAKAGGWRRMDRPDCGLTPEPGEFDPDEDVGFSTLADQVFLNIRRAVGMNRATEAATWMRLYEKMTEHALADAEDALDDPEMDSLDSLDSVFPESNPAPTSAEEATKMLRRLSEKWDGQVALDLIRRTKRDFFGPDDFDHDLAVLADRADQEEELASRTDDASDDPTRFSP